MFTEGGVSKLAVIVLLESIVTVIGLLFSSSAETSPDQPVNVQLLSGIALI